MALETDLELRVGGTPLRLDRAGEAVTALAASLSPSGLLAFSEDLRRFAEACAFTAMRGLELEMDGLKGQLEEELRAEPGMARSVSAGRMMRVVSRQAVAQEVAMVREISHAKASYLVGIAHGMATQVPEVLGALSTGQIGAAQAEVITDVAELIEAEEVAPPADESVAAWEEFERRCAAARARQDQARREFAHTVLGRAEGKTPAQLRRYAKRTVERMRPRSFTQRARRACRGRYVRVEPADDGMAYLIAYLPTLAAEAIERRLNDIVTLQKSTATEIAAKQRAGMPSGVLAGGSAANGMTAAEGERAGTGPEAGEDRTAAQVRADAFVDLLLAGPEGSGLENVQPQVLITVPATLFPGIGAPQAPGTASVVPTEAGQDTAGGETDRLDGITLPAGAELPECEGLGAFDPADLAAILPNASTWTRLVTDPWTGSITAFDTKAYRPTAAMRRALAVRDRTCRAPGCGRRASGCEPDHVTEWQHGGRTTLSNLASLCKRCHRLKSLGLINTQLRPDGTLTTTTHWNTGRSTHPDAPWRVGGSPPTHARSATEPLSVPESDPPPF